MWRKTGEREWSEIIEGSQQQNNIIKLAKISFSVRFIRNKSYFLGLITEDVHYASSLEWIRGRKRQKFGELAA